MPTRHSTICTEHFTDDDFIQLKGKRMVKCTAKPQFLISTSREAISTDQQSAMEVDEAPNKQNFVECRKKFKTNAKRKQFVKDFKLADMKNSLCARKYFFSSKRCLLKASIENARLKRENQRLRNKLINLQEEKNSFQTKIVRFSFYKSSAFLNSKTFVVG